MELKFSLEAFEGPLDLLLHLIDKNKVNIYDIPIAEITAQYMEYIRAMQREDLNIMSEFLVMAATLLDIKAKMLLPAEVDENDEEIDPRADLVEQLIQYKLYKHMSLELKDRQLEAEKHLYKLPTVPDEVLKYEPPVDLDELTQGWDLDKLNAIFQSVMKRKNDKIDPVRAKFGKIEKEQISVDDKLVSVRNYCRKHKQFSFRNLLEKQGSRLEVVVTFLAMLEMVRSGDIRIAQQELFGDILIESFVPEDEEEVTS